MAGPSRHEWTRHEYETVLAYVECKYVGKCTPHPSPQDRNPEGSECASDPALAVRRPFPFGRLRRERVMLHHCTGAPAVRVDCVSSLSQSSLCARVPIYGTGRRRRGIGEVLSSFVARQVGLARCDKKRLSRSSARVQRVGLPRHLCSALYCAGFEFLTAAGWRRRPAIP